MSTCFIQIIKCLYNNAPPLDAFTTIFANRSYLPNFCVLKAPARSEYGNEIPCSQKSCFTIKNVHNINLIQFQNRGKILILLNCA